MDEVSYMVLLADSLGKVIDAATRDRYPDEDLKRSLSVVESYQKSLYEEVEKRIKE